VSTALDLREEFVGLYHDWYAAIANHDRGWFERTLGDEFRYVTFDGAILDKPALIELDMAVRGPTIELRDLDVTPYGDVALVCGHYRAQEELDSDVEIGEFLRDQLRRGLELVWSAVWTRRDGGWQCVLHHGTRVVD
jgi:hypothetical protein